MTVDAYRNTKRTVFFANIDYYPNISLAEPRERSTTAAQWFLCKPVFQTLSTPTLELFKSI